MTRSVCRVRGFSRSLTCHCEICDWTNIRCVNIKNPPIWPTILCYFTAIQLILVQSQIRQWEGIKRLKLPKLHIYHVLIRWELKYLFGASIAGTMIWNVGPGSTRLKDWGFMSGPGNNPALVTRVGLLGGSTLWPEPLGQFQPGPKLRNLEPFLLLNDIWMTLIFRMGPSACQLSFYL